MELAALVDELASPVPVRFIESNPLPSTKGAEAPWLEEAPLGGGVCERRSDASGGLGLCRA